MSPSFCVCRVQLLHACLYAGPFLCRAYFYCFSQYVCSFFNTNVGPGPCPAMVFSDHLVMEVCGPCPFEGVLDSHAGAGVVSHVVFIGGAFEAQHFPHFRIFPCFDGLQIFPGQMPASCAVACCGGCSNTPRQTFLWPHSTLARQKPAVNPHQFACVDLSVPDTQLNGALSVEKGAKTLNLFTA